MVTIIRPFLHVKKQLSIQAKALSCKRTKLTARLESVARHHSVSAPAGISQFHSVRRERFESWAEGGPGGLERKYQFQKRNQVVCFQEFDSRALKARVEVLFDALLTVETCGIIIRQLSCPQLPERAVEVAFCFFDPLQRQPRHT